MKSSVRFRTLTATTVGAFVATTLATSASAEEVTPATLTLGETSVVTLPAADGVRDATSLAIDTDATTTVELAVRWPGDVTPIKTLPSVTVTAGTPLTVSVPVSGLPSGELEVVATPTGGSEFTQTLTVGSGEPIDIGLAMSPTTIYTWSGAAQRTSKATVTANDETGLRVPFKGNVVGKVASSGVTVTLPVTSTTGSASATFWSSKLGNGTAIITAKLAGPSKTVYTSDAQTVKVLQHAVTAVAVRANATTFYPKVDGYKDTVTITVTPTSNIDRTFTSTGTVKITRSGKTYKTWNLTSNAPRNITWNGVYNGSYVPAGKYTITTKLKGPEGSTRTATTSVTVSSGRLVTKTTTVNYKPHSVFPGCIDYSWYYDSECEYDDNGYIYFSTWGSDYDYALIAEGSLAIPSAVVSAAKFGGAKAAATIRVAYGYGYADLDYGPTSTEYVAGEVLFEGSNTLNTIAVPNGSTRLYLGIGLGDYSDLWVDRLSVKYTYKAMSY